MKALVSLVIICMTLSISAQTSFSVSDSEVTEIITGSFLPEDHAPSNPVANADELRTQLLKLVSPEELKLLEVRLEKEGIHKKSAKESSAWVFSQFSEFSNKNENRLKPFYLEYQDDQQQRIACALLPGRYNNVQDVVVVEALAKEDIVLEAALVLEFARIMSELDFDSNLLFVINLNEAQAATAEGAFRKYTESSGPKVGTRFDYDIITGWADKFPGIFMAYRGCR